MPAEDTFPLESQPLRCVHRTVVTMVRPPLYAPEAHPALFGAIKTMLEKEASRVREDVCPLERFEDDDVADLGLEMCGDGVQEGDDACESLLREDAPSLRGTSWDDTGAIFDGEQKDLRGSLYVLVEPLDEGRQVWKGAVGHVGPEIGTSS